MPERPERIPVPWPQRWELLRERALPVVCFFATLVACGWLWRYQATVAPVAIGEVHGDVAVVKSPCDGELLAISDDGQPPKLFTDFEQNAIVARVKDASAADTIVEILAPLSGKTIALAARPGEHVKQGDPLVTIASPQSNYIVCQIPDHGQAPPEVGAQVAIRRQARGARWTPTTVEAVGPSLQAPPALENGTARALPIRIALPKDVALPPGSLVDVRFPPVSL